MSDRTRPLALELLPVHVRLQYHARTIHMCKPALREVTAGSQGVHRLTATSNFLRAAENERSHAPRVPDSIVLTAEAEVELVARSHALREAASLLTEQALYYKVETEYRKVRNRFIDLAQAEIESGT